MLPRLSSTSPVNQLHRRRTWTPSRTLLLIDRKKGNPLVLLTGLQHLISVFPRCLFAFISLSLLTSLTFPAPFLGSRPHFSFVRFSSCERILMATTPEEDADPMSNRYIPRAARAVPHDEIVHTIEFRKITYPLTGRPAELWIAETNHRGHTQWRTLERFLDDFVPTPLGASSEYSHGMLRSPGNPCSSMA